MANECSPNEHVWSHAQHGSKLSGGKPLKFCVRCEREEWKDGTVIPGWAANTVIIDFDD